MIPDGEFQGVYVLCDSLGIRNEGVRTAFERIELFRNGRTRNRDSSQLFP
jgi:hypothetical protein